MPDVSAFCPVCGRAVESEAERNPSVPDVAPLSRHALVAVIAYMTFVPALVFLLVPPVRKIRFVRFHSLQSLLLTVATLAIGGAARLMFAILSMLGFLLSWLLVGLVALAIVFLWIIVVVKAGLGDAYELPVIGPFAASLANRE